MGDLNSALAYLDQVLECLASGSEELESETFTLYDEAPDLALLEATLRYPGNVRLDVALYVECSVSLVWRKYSFHARDARNGTIFRYDDFNGHSDVGTAPHHKHCGPQERIEPSQQPNPALIRDEVLMESQRVVRSTYY